MFQRVQAACPSLRSNPACASMLRPNHRTRAPSQLAAGRTGSSGAPREEDDRIVQSLSAAGSGAPRQQQQRMMSRRYRHILLNIPNSIGWLRLALLVAAVSKAAAAPRAAFNLCLFNMMLDFVDGWAARQLQQSTSFGAVFDVLLDVALRGWLWVTALPPAAALWPPLLELTVFAFTHKVAGSSWKQTFFACGPGWVQAVMAGGFRSLPGALAVLGLMGCPLWLWARRHLPGSLYAADAWGVLLVPARLLAAAVEGWVVLKYMHMLLEEDTAADDNADGQGGAAAGA